MNIVLAAAIALMSANTFGQAGHYRELFEVCINMRHPTATQTYCACSAQRLVERPEPEQLLLIEMATLYARTPDPRPQQAKQMQAELRARHRSDQGFDARLNIVKQVGTAVAHDCAPPRQH